MPESSPTDDVQLDSSPSTAVDDAESAPAATSESPPSSVLDAVEIALNTDSSPEASRATDGPAENTKPEENGPESSNFSDPDEEVPPEELKQYSARAQERIRELAAVKNELRAENETLAAQNKEFQGKAEAFESLKNYLGESGITSEEANNALEITRLIKTHDYDRAYQVILPIFQELNARVGGVLDDDLNEDVRLGTLPAKRAQELQRGRAASKNNQAREEGRTQIEERQRDQQDRDAFSRHVLVVAKAADDWAAQKARGDADWPQKQDLVTDALGIIIQREGFPKTTEQAIELSERALAKVEKALVGTKRRASSVRIGGTTLRPRQHWKPSSSDSQCKAKVGPCWPALGAPHATRHQRLKPTSSPGGPG